MSGNLDNNLIFEQYSKVEEGIVGRTAARLSGAGANIGQSFKNIGAGVKSMGQVATGNYKGAQQTLAGTKAPEQAQFDAKVKSITDRYLKNISNDLIKLNLIPATAEQKIKDEVNKAITNVVTTNQAATPAQSQPSNPGPQAATPTAASTAPSTTPPTPAAPAAAPAAATPTTPKGPVRNAKGQFVSKNQPTPAAPVATPATPAAPAAPTAPATPGVTKTQPTSPEYRKQQAANVQKAKDELAAQDKKKVGKFKDFNDSQADEEPSKPKKKGILGKIASLPGAALRTAGKVIHAPDKFGAALQRFVRTGEVGGGNDYEKYKRSEFNRSHKKEPYKSNKKKAAASQGSRTPRPISNKKQS